VLYDAHVLCVQCVLYDGAVTTIVCIGREDDGVGDEYGAIVLAAGIIIRSCAMLTFVSHPRLPHTIQPLTYLATVNARGCVHWCGVV